MTEWELAKALAFNARESAALFREYLEWSEDPSQREWAAGCAAAWDALAVAYEKRAADLRAREAVAAVQR